jgi:hypothetical protein
MGTFQESSIWEGRVTEESTFIPGSFIIGSGHISSGQINASHVSPAQIGFSQIGSNQLSPGKQSANQISPAKADLGEISFSKFTANQLSPAEITTAHVISREAGSAEIAFGKVDSVNGFANWVIDFPTSSSTQISINQFNLEEVPLSFGVTLKELFSSDSFKSHNTILQNTTVPTWLEFLQGTTLFNLNIEIADLPTGQLVEATITGFDPTGRPNSGTLYLDIDPTPWDSSEYSQPLTDTAYRATPDSAAYNHYDLLTTLLHETAHLQGILSGYSNYDRHIQTINGSKTPGLSEVDAFIGDSFSAVLITQALSHEQVVIIPNGTVT